MTGVIPAMIKPKPIFWIALIVLALIYFNNREPAPEPPAPTATPAQAEARSTFSPVPTLPLPTPDPYAYKARNWQQIMPTPSVEQISLAKGSARSPYIAIYHHFPNVNRVLEYAVDLHADHEPKGTYLCPLNWWMDVSALQARYASVYNDYTGVPGGYCGFQTLEDGSHVFIMTVWSTFCRDYAGNVTVFTPTVLYPAGQGRGNTTDAEGSFTHCILPFDWHAGRDYRVLVQQSRSESTGNVVLSTSVCDLQKNEWYLLASFDTGVPDVYMCSVGGFLENFLTDYAGEVRSMDLRNLKARSADSYQWVNADSVQFLLNGSNSPMDYAGSASFGTDGASIWAITSGVSGLCQAPSDALSYPLLPGDAADPY